MKHTGIMLLMLFPIMAFAQDWKIFTDTAGMFTASYPAIWDNKIKTGNRVFFTSPAEKEGDIFRQNVNISVSTNPEYGTSYTIKDVSADVLESVRKSFLSFNEESNTLITWNGIEACEITYTGYSKSDEQIWIRIKQRMCFYKTRLYLVTYVALAEEDVYKATAMKIINSIKFKP
ncbi:MAG: hypothetical protein WAU23_11425 [Ferruginibacter sp.]